jgi:hypothetical protein
MQTSFVFESIIDYCAEIRIHPVLSQHKVQLIELFLM